MRRVRYYEIVQIMLVVLEEASVVVGDTTNDGTIEIAQQHCKYRSFRSIGKKLDWMRTARSLSDICGKLWIPFYSIQ
jgi:hypothetical protein